MALAVSVKRVRRVVFWVIGLAVGAILAILGGFATYAVMVLPEPQPWHTTILKSEFRAERDGKLDFGGYLKLEDRLFAELREKQARWNRKNEAFVYSRFNPNSRVSRLFAGAPFNRSFRLAHPEPIGRALLIHGLTDSPYSMKAMAESLHGRGFEVTVLRIPGHGTLPSMMTQMSLADWQAATSIAARDVAGRTRPGELFYIGGYSTGGTLAVQYALDSLADPKLKKPDRVLLVSPAIEIPKVAALSNLLEVFSIIPVRQLQKARWQSIAVEYDPYKYNSFPVNATRQVNRATRMLQAELAKAGEDGRILKMPPVTAFQSVVDSTVGPNGVADLLFARLKGAQHRLVLFDVNRHDALGSIQRPASESLVRRLALGKRGYSLDIVSNFSTGGRQLRIHHFGPDGNRSTSATPLEWPDTLVSVGHVALPFPPNDPAYGMNPGSGRNGIPSLGSWLYRGESGAVSVDLGLLTRPRSNPFWPLIDEGVGAAVEADRAERK